MSRSLLIAVLTFSLSGCASHRVPGGDGDRTMPRIGWVIMQGPPDNPDDEFVCQSDPRTPCEMTASQSDRPRHSHVYLYFHPFGVDARYEGTAVASFLGQGRPMQLNAAVSPGNVANHSVVGIVTDKPGEYALDIKASATGPDGPTRIEEHVPVTVK